MGIDRRKIIFGLLVVVFGLLYFFNGSFSGNVIWEPVTEIDNCSEVDIRALWDEIFVESSDEVVVYRENDVVCGNFVAWKNKSSELFYLEYGFSDEISYLADENYTRYNTTDIFAAYLNTTDELVLVPVILTKTYNDFFSRVNLLASNVNNFNDWDGEASDFSNYFVINFDIPASPPWVDDGDRWVWEMEQNSDSSLESLGKNVHKYRQTVSAGYILENIVLGPLTSPVFKQNVSNYTFEMNSSWNDAFGIGGVVDLEEGWSASVVDVSNSINTDSRIYQGEVQFEPKDGKIGNSSFRLSATGNGVTETSNVFYVNIVEDINYRPTFSGEIKQIYVERGGNTTVSLHRYFEDADGDDLTYTTNSLDDIIVSFSGDVMTVKLGVNFSNYRRFKVYASDGANARVSSDEIDVFLDTLGSNRVNSTLNSSLNSSLLYGLDSNDGSNNSANSTGEGGWSVNWKFLIWGFVVVVVILGIGVGVWFFMNRKKGVVNPVVDGGVDKVSEYLQSLEMKK